MTLLLVILYHPLKRQLLITHHLFRLTIHSIYFRVLVKLHHLIHVGIGFQ